MTGTSPRHASHDCAHVTKGNEYFNPFHVINVSIRKEDDVIINASFAVVLGEEDSKDSPAEDNGIKFGEEDRQRSSHQMKRRERRFAPHSKGSLHLGVGVHLRGQLSDMCIPSRMLVLSLLLLRV